MKTLQEASYLALIAIEMREAVHYLQWLPFETRRDEMRRKMNHIAIRLMMDIMQHSTQMISLFDPL